MEQTLIEDLIVESIKMHGIDCWYIPRTLGTKDDLLNEDDTPIFDQAYEVEMYIKNVDGFQGDGQFLSKFGLQIRDSMTLSVAMRRFEAEVSQQSNQIRPNEGDLIYFPLNQKIFEVQFVDQKPIFYQLGALQMYDLRCELFEYSYEKFNTGVTEIDQLYVDRDTNSNTSIQFLETNDSYADNFTIQTAANTVLDFSEENPWGENTY
jgi:hypothetical protein